MPNPALSDVHVNRPLTNISVAYIQNQDMFIADKVFPTVPVQKQSDRYFVYSRDDFYRIEADVRAPGTESAGAGWRVDNTPNYSASVYALHKDVDEQIAANADSPLDMDRDATIYLTQQMLLKRDKVWATNYFKTSVWTGGSGGATDQTGAGSAGSNQFKQWDLAGSTPIEDIRAQVTAIAQTTGFRPNTLVLGAQVWQKLVDHAEFTDRIKYTQGPAIVTEQMVAQVLGLKNVVVAWAVENTAVEPAAGTDAFIFGKGALLLYANPTPSLMQPSAGYIFAWTGLPGAGPWGNRIKRFYMDWIAANRVEMDMAFDAKVVASDCGCFFTTAVS